MANPPTFRFLPLPLFLFRLGSNRTRLGGIGAVLGFGLSLHGALASGDFSTSFEEGEPSKVFENRVETREKSPLQQNVTAKVSTSLEANATAVTASAENPPDEGAAQAADSNPGTKWLLFQPKGWLQYEFKSPMKAVEYRVTSGNDRPDRDPRDWVVLGSDDGKNWTKLDAQKDQSWEKGQRRVARTYRIASPRAFRFYRLDVASNHADRILQIADWELIPAKITVDPKRPMVTTVDSGPMNGYNLKPRAGFTGLRALRYAGQHTAAGHGYAMNRLFDVNIPVGKNTRLSYNIFPELTGNDLQYPSTHVAVNLRFTDGTELFDLHPLDVYEISATAQGQGAGKILYPDQWNHVRIDVGAVAAGKTISAIQLCYDNEGAGAKTAFQGWIDDIRIEAEPARIDGSSLTHYVDTRRGTNSSGAFSRGSNEAITSIPNGFNFLVPVTNAEATSREYAYQSDNDAKNRPRFEGLAVSHQPSPWMGDRNQFSVMPVAGGEPPSGNWHRRAVTFRHDRETAQPDYYGVDLDNDVKAEMTPTNRGMLMRFTFPGAAGSVTLDSPTENGEFAIDPASGAVTGWIDHGAGFRASQSRMFVAGAFDQKPSAVGTAKDGRPLTKFATFQLGPKREVTLRLATSLISLEQAKKNLALEIGRQGFDEIREKARAIWNDRLGVIRVEGASETELVTLYSNLYRLNLYPNAQFENVGTAEKPAYAYASPVNRPEGPSSATRTGAKIFPGRMYVNNGFWDTYRTTWPAYSLLYPKIAAEMIDGFVDQYRAGGWIARWSSPGYANVMTGTSSDVAFADAYLRGVPLPDPLATYDAAVKNASTPSDNNNVGRKSLKTSIFLGYTPSSQDQSVSWATEGFINDFGIGNMAAALAEDPATPDARRASLREESEYYLDRARSYGRLFDPAIGFFQARRADGAFDVPAKEYNPTKWWGPYTETNGWNFAFHAPHDPQGLVNLYGGREKLEAKLDEFFTTPETSPGPIHEEVEARDGRYGQWGVSNQVSHHIPFIYNAVGAPAKAQKIVREALQRSFAGSEIGQGYPGDEDNGEMSAWYIFNALGLYPLQVGSTQLVIGSPLFDRATVNLENGKKIVITAAENGPKNVYVQSLKVDGAPYDRTTIDSKIFHDGATLDFVMGDRPSAWGTRPEDAPPSLTKGAAKPAALADATEPKISAAIAGGGDAAALFDNTSATEVKFATANPTVTLSMGGKKVRPTFYTLTAAAEEGHDVSAWVLEGSNDGATWTELDVRKAQAFAHRRQTIPFKIQRPGAFQKFRLRVTEGAANAALSEIELLTPGEDS